MLYPFCKYEDETEVSFSDIKINDKNEEYIYIHFERPTENGFDSIRFELPTYKVVYKEGNYSDDEILLFKKIIEQGAPYFYKWSREGGIKIA